MKQRKATYQPIVFGMSNAFDITIGTVQAKLKLLLHNKQVRSPNLM